jgi:putative aminopeptidase FrvX
VMSHIDEIGVMVRHIDDKGYLRFGGVGGWDSTILAGQRVDVMTRNGRLPGVVGKKPIHLMESEERTKAPDMKDLYIDVGAKDGDDARTMVREGDVAVIAVEPVELPNGRLISRALDNRLGCYIALRAAQLVAEAGGAAGDVVAVAAVQEETTFGGSATTAYALRPDLAIVVDVSHATDAPGIDVNELGSHALGSGPVVERGSNLNPRVVELLHDAGEAEDIPFTLAASARHTGTDADAMHLSRGGIPCGLVGLPLRYMHSPVEMVDLADIDAAARLIAAAARRLAADASFTR